MSDNERPSLRAIRECLISPREDPNRMRVSRAAQKGTLVRIARGIYLPASTRRPPPLAPKDNHSRVTHLCPDHAKGRLCSDWRMCGMDPRPPRRYRQGADYRLCANQSRRTETLLRCGSHRFQTGYAGGSSFNYPNISPGIPDRRRLRYPFCSAHPGRLRAARCRGAGLHADVRWHGSLGKLLTLRPARFSRTSRTGAP